MLTVLTAFCISFGLKCILLSSVFFTPVYFVLLKRSVDNPSQWSPTKVAAWSRLSVCHSQVHFCGPPMQKKGKKNGHNIHTSPPDT